MPVRGGQGLKDHLRRSKAPGGREVAVHVGWFSTAKYPDGTQVAAVAGWLEFGTRSRTGSVHIPERPFIRSTIRRTEDEVRDLIAEHMDPVTGLPDERLTELLGEYVKGEIQREITTTRTPPNAPSTIARKGSSNPLIDTGVMRQAVTHRTVTR